MPKLVLASTTLASALLAGSASALLAGSASASTDREWRFAVTLDGSPIGTQTFRVRDDDAERTVSIEASFDVKMLFLTVYSYRHRNEETWRNGCLSRLDASTDDNGETFRVSATASGDGLRVRDGREERMLPGCVRSFAYWDLAALKSPALLNSQTGAFEAVSLRELGEETIESRGRRMTAKRMVLEGDKLQIDLWYSRDGDWLALESTMSRGSRLRYALE